MKPSLEDVLEKAAQVQELVPGAVLVGGSAAALYARHRQSFDHDHVIADLVERFARWHDWSTVTAVLAELAERITR